MHSVAKPRCNICEKDSFERNYLTKRKVFWIFTVDLWRYFHYISIIFRESPLGPLLYSFEYNSLHGTWDPCKCVWNGSCLLWRDSRESFLNFEAAALPGSSRRKLGIHGSVSHPPLFLELQRERAVLCEWSLARNDNVALICVFFLGYHRSLW